MEEVKVPIWQKTWVVVLACIFVPPAGIALLWVGKKGGLALRIVLTVVLGLYSLGWLAGLFGGGSETTVAEEEPVQVTEEADNYGEFEYKLTDTEMTQAISVAKEAINQYTKNIAYPKSNDDWNIIETKDDHWLISTTVKVAGKSDQLVSVVSTKDTVHYIQVGYDVYFDDNTVE